jgi:hypothetical protein
VNPIWNSITWGNYDYDEEEKITWRDGFVTLYSIIRYGFFD